MALILPREFTKIANGGSVLRSVVSLIPALDSSAGTLTYFIDVRSFGRPLRTRATKPFPPTPLTIVIVAPLPEDRAIDFAASTNESNRSPAALIS